MIMNHDFFFQFVEFPNKNIHTMLSLHSVKTVFLFVVADLQPDERWYRRKGRDPGRAPDH